MGLFDVFKGGGSGIDKHIARVANKRAQQHERWESIQTLAADGSDEAIRGLLTRFGMKVDPSITDREEKNEAFRCIVSLGEAAVQPVQDLLQSTDTLAWPLKMLKELRSDEQVTDALLGLLSKMDTEYERDPQKKIDVLASLEERADVRIVAAVMPFLDDMNETVRFHSVGAIFAQENAADAQEALVTAFIGEESVRVRMQVLDGYISRKWLFTDRTDEVSKRIPNSYALGKKGDARKK